MARRNNNNRGGGIFLKGGIITEPTETTFHTQTKF